MPTGTRTKPQLKARALGLLECNYSVKTIADELDIAPSTIAGWVSDKRRTTTRLDRHKVSKIRELLTRYDEGMTMSGAAKATGVNKGTARRWVTDPRFREATYEYDDTFEYDGDDITDCSVVAHYLCQLTTDLAERLELMFAGASLSDPVPDDDNSTDHKQLRIGSTRKRKAPR